MSQENDGRQAAGTAACEPGDWVEVERVLLEPADRAPGLPANTASTPLRMWVKGFALDRARIGDEVEIETMTGRVELGRLIEVSPGYTHTFGEPPRELAAVGRDLRARLADWRAGRDAGGA
ncbi:MAG: 2-amino-4-ketopentanoate thiolase [Actinobacteria bacterium HGW-Actinobacteria-10]|nr:MAG: 2-amino-4-ketopentanoate thiolase [Actinobacteria bacterium HGW-Actinobacteria-10]